MVVVILGTVDYYNDEYPVIFFTAIWFPVFFFGLVFLQKFIAPNSIQWRSILGTWRNVPVNLFVGLLNCLNGILVVYASDPQRTSPSLQALLSTSVIPFTVICRYIFLRKGKSTSQTESWKFVKTTLKRVSFISVIKEKFNKHPLHTHTPYTPHTPAHTPPHPHLLSRERLAQTLLFTTNWCCGVLQELFKRVNFLYTLVCEITSFNPHIKK